MNEKFSYSKAFEELQVILDELEGGNIEVDKLSSKVKRASELIKLCREKLKKTELEIKEIVKEFEEEKNE